MAENINANLETVGFVNLGVKARPNLVVLKRTKMPAVLVEVGFLNSNTDNQLFDENFNDITLAIADGILETLEEVARENAVNQTETGQEMLSSESDADRQSETYFENNENRLNEMDSANSNNVPYAEYSADNAQNKIDSAAESANLLESMRSEQSIGSSRNAATNNNVETARNDTLNNNTESSGNNGPDNRLSEKARLPRPGAYRVQVGLYRNWVYAQRLLDELLAAGYPAYLDESGPYIRVQVGPFMTLMEAVRMERKLRRDGYDTLVIRGK